MRWSCITTENNVKCNNRKVLLLLGGRAYILLWFKCIERHSLSKSKACGQISWIVIRDARCLVTPKCGDSGTSLSQQIVTICIMDCEICLKVYRSKLDFFRYVTSYQYGCNVKRLTDAGLHHVTQLDEVSHVEYFCFSCKENDEEIDFQISHSIKLIFP